MIKRAACPICYSKALTFFDSILFENQRLDYFRCKKCDLIFMNPMPTQSWYNHFYASTFWEKKSENQTNSRVQLNTRQWRKELAWADKFLSFLKKTKIQLKEKSLVLEVGCAFGLIVHSIANHFNAEALGVEPSHSARDFATRYTNVKFIAENMDQLTKWQADIPLDLVLCSHVIENIVDLDMVFTTIYRILDNKGYLLIDTPNIFSQKSLSIYHPYCFCKKSISTLLSKFGFKIVASQTSGRAKEFLTPRFLTIIAQKNSKTTVSDIKQDSYFGAKIFFSRLWRKITLVKPIKIIDQGLQAIIFPPSEYNMQNLHRLKKEILKTAGPNTFLPE